MLSFSIIISVVFYLFIRSSEQIMRSRKEYAREIQPKLPSKESDKKLDLIKRNENPLTPKLVKILPFPFIIFWVLILVLRFCS